MSSLDACMRASFTIGMYLIAPFGSIPQEQVTIRLASESVILFASSEAANPPNTTEWIAPIHAQANIDMTASGIIGM